MKKSFWKVGGPGECQRLWPQNSTGFWWREVAGEDGQIREDSGNPVILSMPAFQPARAEPPGQSLVQTNWEGPASWRTFRSSETTRHLASRGQVSITAEPFLPGRSRSRPPFPGRSTCAPLIPKHHILLLLPLFLATA